LPEIINRTTDDGLSDIILTPDSVRDVLRKLKPTTSTGLDGIPIFFLKSCAYSFASPLPHIFHFSFNDGRLPYSWKSAVVMHACSQERTNIDRNNFLPVSLTASRCKVAERVTNKTLPSYLLNQCFITIHQHGFIKRKSITSNLLECLEDWTLNLQSRHVTDVIFIDFKKAFDTCVTASC